MLLPPDVYAMRTHSAVYAIGATTTQWIC